MKRETRLLITFIIVTLLVSIGISFAYFTANASSEETDTITVIGGKMNIVYDGGPEINAQAIAPSDNPIVVKTFTVTGDNTTELEMNYKLSLIISNNSFSEEALSYQLVSTNTNHNGEVAPNINMTNLGTGAKIIDLGYGTFYGPTNGNKTHTYRLEIYFPNQEYNQNVDQEKSFSAYIKIENYTPSQGLLIRDVILAQGDGTVAIQAKGNPNFANIATESDSGLYATEDDYGISYYFRGLKDKLNNNLIWGGFQWKIVRINGDGSIRLIYNGTEAEFDQNGVVNDTGTNTQIGQTEWNAQYYNDAKYVGYMYGGANGQESTKRNGNDSQAATFNETSSTIKDILDDWYEQNILGKPFESQVVDNLFCNDRQLQSEIGGADTGPGYGITGNYTYYADYYRQEIDNPTLKCNQKNDRFTVNDTTTGNGVLTYPIGLLTADEGTIAGLVSINSNNYLYNNQYWWTMTPSYMSTVGAFMMTIYSSGYIGSYYVISTYGIRPIISISSDILVMGNGSAENPFIAV